MKRTYRYGWLVALLFLLPGIRMVGGAQRPAANPLPGTLPWQVQTLDMRGDIGEYNALALDSRGRAHLIYYDRAIDTRLGYGYYDGLIWQFETLPIFLPENNYFEPGLALAIDNSDNPHIAYYHHQAGDIYYANRNATGWHVTLVEATGDVGSDLSLNLAPGPVPHLSYYDATNQNLKHAWRSGPTWQSEIVDSVGNVGQYNSLALDSSGQPHISYYDASNADLKYAYKNGSTWVIETVLSQGNVGQGTSLALDGGNEPHIAHVYSGNTSFELHYTQKIGTDWLSQTVSTLNVGTLSLALASDGTAHIAFDALGSYLYYADNTQTTWTIAPVDTASENGINPSIGVTAAGEPHISYYLSEYQDLRYAIRAPEWSTATIDPIVNNNSFIALAYDSIGTPHISYNDGGFLRVTGWDGLTWTADTPLPTATDPRHSSLRYDTQGYPHLAFYQATTADLLYAFWNGSTWTVMPVDSGGDVGQYARLMFSRDGVPIIAYWDNSNYRVKAAALLNSSWVIGTHTTGPSLNGDSGRIAAGLSLDGTLFISYYDAPNSDLRVALAQLNGTTWTWQDEIVGTTEGHTGPAHDLAMAANGYYPVLAYDYSDSAGNHALRYATRFPGPAWSSTQFRPLPGANGVVALGLSLRANDANMARVAYILDEPSQKSLWLATNNGLSWSFEPLGTISVATGYAWPRPVVLANDVDRIAYLDGSSLKLTSRATTKERPFVSADVLGYSPDPDGAFGFCFCMLMLCLDWDAAAPPDALLNKGNGDLGQGVVFAEMTGLFSATPGGQHYLALYEQHGLEMYQVMTRYPVVLWDSYRTLHNFLPGLEALVTGRGDEVVITGQMVAHAYDVWLSLAILGSPELRSAIYAELAQTNNLQDFVGMTFNEWAAAIGVEPPEGQKQYLPLLVK